MKTIRACNCSLTATEPQRETQETLKHKDEAKPPSDPPSLSISPRQIKFVDSMGKECCIPLAAQENENPVSISTLNAL